MGNYKKQLDNGGDMGIIDFTPNITPKESPVEAPIQSLGDILDKLTILTRKIQFGMEDAISEHRYLEKGLSYYGIDGKLVTYIIRLAQMNFEIWNLEHEVRMKGEESFALEEIGRRALAVRKFNTQRIEQKNKINTLMKSEFREVKVNHAS